MDPSSTSISRRFRGHVGGINLALNLRMMTNYLPVLFFGWILGVPLVVGLIERARVGSESHDNGRSFATRQPA